MSHPMLLLLAVLLPAWAAAGQLYKYADSEGRVQFTDRPPKGVQAEALNIRVPSDRGPAQVENPGGRAGLPAAAEKARVTLYGNQSCGYCRRARAYLNERNVPFRDLDVDEDPAAREDYRRLNGRGVPVILVGNRRMNGFDQVYLEQLLQDAGY